MRPRPCRDDTRRFWARGLALLATSAMLSCARVPADLTPQTELEVHVAAPTVVVEAPSVAPTCSARTPPGALLLIPDAAEWAVHIRPDELLRSAAYKLIAPQLEQIPDWTMMLDAWRPCGLGFETIDRLVVGFNAAEDFVAIFVAPGIARPETARCVIMQLQVAFSEDPVADIMPMPGDASVSVVEFSDGRAYLFGDDLFVLTTATWRDAIADLSSCNGSPASVATALRGLDLEAPLWLAGAPPTSMLVPLGDMLGADLAGTSSIGASVHLDDGATLRTRVQMRDATTANDTAQMLRTLTQTFGAMLPPELVGLPSRVGIDSHDAELWLEATLRIEELRYIAGQMP
jgi:hypothetical protein